MVASGLQVGLSSYTYPWAVGTAGHRPRRPLTAETIVARAAELGVPVVQLADNVALHTRTDASLLRLVDLARRCGVQLEVGTRGIAPEHLRRYRQIATLVGSPVLRVVVDDAGHEPEPDEIVALLRPHEDEFRDHGVTLAIENHDRLPSATLAGIVEELGTAWVGVCLDTVNSFGALEGPDVVIDTLAPLAVNVHVKDFEVVRIPSNLGFEVRGCPVGAGRLDVPRLLAAVAGRLPRLSAVIELWTPRQATLRDTVELERRWAEASVAALTREVARAASDTRPGP